MGDMPIANAAVFLFKDSFGLFGLLIKASSFWAVLATLVTIGVVQWRRNRSDVAHPITVRTGHWGTELLALTAAPLLILLIALYQWPRGNVLAAHEKLALYAVAVLLYAQLLLGVVLIWRHRKRFASTVLAVGFAMVWTIGSNMMAAMAISDQWL
jgi:hypothetical protein